MTLEKLQADMIAAMKAHEKERKDAISTLVSAVKKKGIDEGCRNEIPEEMVDAVITKELKSVKEQIDTCPAERTELLAEYKFRYDVISEYAPKMMDEAEVKAFIEANFAEVLESKNQGQIMKNVMPALKGKADGKVINQVVASFCK